MESLGPGGRGRRRRRVQWEGKGGNKSHPGWTLELDSVVLHGYSSTRRCCAGLNTLRETTGAAPIRSRTSCAKPVQTYIKHVPKMLGSIPKSTKIVTRSGPKSMKIGVWMGLCPLFFVTGALGREFSGKLRARCAKLGQDGSKLRPRWATMASRWPSWAQLAWVWGHLGGKLDDRGGVGGVFWRCLGVILKVKLMKKQAKTTPKVFY